LGEALGTEVPANAPLMSVGLDSIAAVEFTNTVSVETGITFSAIMLFDHPTLNSITSYLLAELELGAAEDSRAQSVIEQDAGARLVSTPAGR
jgi:acyl carrier protein